MSDDDVQIKFGAQISELKSAMEQANDSVKGALGDMQDSLKDFGDKSAQASQQVAESQKKMVESVSSAHDKLSSSLDTLKTGFLALAGAVGAGALFKGIMDATVDWGNEVGRLSSRLGISTEKASDLAMSFKILGMSSDEYLQIAQRLERNVKQNADVMENLGIVLKDPVTGNAKDLVDVMEQVRAKIAEYAPGANQAQIAMALMGGRAGDLSKFLRLDNEMMAEGAKTARELGMELDKNGVQAVHKYEEELNKFHGAWQAVEMKIGQVLLGPLKDLAAWLNESGPTAIRGCITVIDELAKAFVVAAADAEKLVAVWHTVASMPAHIKDALMGGDSSWAKDKADLNANLAGINETMKARLAEIDATTQKALQKTQPFVGPPEPSAPLPGKQTADADIQKAKDQAATAKGAGGQDPVATLNKQLEDMLRLYENWDKNASAIAEQFWAAQLQHTKAGSEEAKEIWRSLMDAQKQLYTEGQTQAQQAAKNAETISKGAADMQRSDAQTTIKIEEERINELYALGQVSAGQRFSQLQALYNQEYALEIKAYYDELAILQQRGDATLAQQVKTWDAIEKAQNQHLLKMQKDEDQYLNTEKTKWDGYANQVSSAMSQMLFHHQSLMRTMQQLEEKFFSYVIDTLLKRLVSQWLASEATKTAATTMGATERAAAESMGSSMGLMSLAASALKAIGSYAAETFAGVYSALAGIPYVGPFIAPPAAAGAMAAVLSVEGMVASAAGG